MHQCNAQQHDEGPVGVGPDAGQAAEGHPQRERQKDKRDQKLRPEDRVPKPRAHFHEKHHRRDRQRPDRRHEVDMGGLPAGHPQNKFGQMQRVPFMLADVERPFQERQQPKNANHGEKHTYYRNPVRSGVQSPAPFCSIIRPQ